MDYLAFMLRGVWAKKARSIGLALAIAFAVLIVVTLQVSSSSLEQSAAAVISVGKADITVVQKGVADVLSSTIDEGELARIRPGPRCRERGGGTGGDRTSERRYPALH